jgi:hypothetical protein
MMKFSAAENRIEQNEGLKKIAILLGFWSR